jgi:hypothetical protein
MSWRWILVHIAVGMQSKFTSTTSSHGRLVATTIGAISQPHAVVAIIGREIAASLASSDGGASGI